jgi:hypothetical protein
MHFPSTSDYDILGGIPAGAAAAGDQQQPIQALPQNLHEQNKDPLAILSTEILSAETSIDMSRFHISGSSKDPPITRRA